MEAYHYLRQRGYHRLSYKEYLRAGELDIALPEAKPTYHVGLLTGDDPEPVAVDMPKDFPLAKCYRFGDDQSEEETDEANAHLLAALGRFAEPFVPVRIHRDYDGYSWAKLPTIGKVELMAGRILYEATIWSGCIACVDSLEITGRTSDGKVWRSPACMAIRPVRDDRPKFWWDHQVLLTAKARDQLSPTDILYHLGGFSDEGDTWQTQECEFSQELDRFWDGLSGPDETLRRRILEPFDGFEDWHHVTLLADGTVTIHFADGTERVIRSPVL